MALSDMLGKLPKVKVGLLGGFKVTLEEIRKPAVTVQYPEQKRQKPVRTHGRHVLNRYEDGMEKCIGCELCAGVCPADCIYVRGADNDLESPVSPGERYGFVYEINYLRCIHCDLCVEACPTEAITESKMFEFSFTNRADAIYTKSELLVDDQGRPQKMPWEDWREGDDLHTSAWMRATSPGGRADYEGQVQWSGELGYGVRAPEAGQSGERNDAATGSRQLRETLSLHLNDKDRLPGQRGIRGAMNRTKAKIEAARRGSKKPGSGGAFPVSAKQLAVPAEQVAVPAEQVAGDLVATGSASTGTVDAREAVVGSVGTEDL